MAAVTVNSPANSSSRCQSTMPSICRVVMFRLTSSTPTMASDQGARSTGRVNTAISAAAASIALASLPRSSGGAALLAAVALAGSNTIGNVPLVVMLLASGLPLGTEGLYRLALFSTLSGNLLVVGSIANIIVVERARSVGVIIGFLDYARVGVPVTALSLVFAWLWTEVLLPLLTGGP